MIKSMITILFFLLTSISFSQEIVSEQPISSKEYLRISKAQKVAAWIFVGSAVTLVAVVAPGNIPFDKLPLPILGIGASVLTSTILFIASARNKRKGLALYANIGIHKNPALSFSGIKEVHAPALTLKASF